MHHDFDMNKLRDSKPYWFVKKLFLLLSNKRRTALASFPRSGNTWLRSLLEVSTNEQSGSIYQDPVLRRSNDGIVIKTHALDAFRYTHALHLIRNPFDAIYSFYLYKGQVENKQVDWDAHVVSTAELWKQHTQYWEFCRIPVLRTRYEDLSADTHNELKRILNWMRFECSSQSIDNAIEASNIQMLRKANPGVGEKFFREGKIGDGILHFSDKQKDYIYENLKDLLINLKYL